MPALNKIETFDRQRECSRMADGEGQVLHGERGQRLVCLLQESHGLQSALSHRRRLRRRHPRQAHLPIQQYTHAAEAQQ